MESDISRDAYIVAIFPEFAFIVSTTCTTTLAACSAGRIDSSTSLLAWWQFSAFCVTDRVDLLREVNVDRRRLIEVK